MFLLTRPSRGATRIPPATTAEKRLFLLTRPSRGATGLSAFGSSLLGCFYSHAPRGARLTAYRQNNQITGFLLTRPSRGATLQYRDFTYLINGFYSHAPRGARPHNVAFHMQSHHNKQGRTESARYYILKNILKNIIFQANPCTF